MAEGVIANPTDNSALAQFQGYSADLVNWSQALSTSANNILSIFQGINKVKDAPVATVPSTINQTVAQQSDDYKKMFALAGLSLIVIAGGIFFYKKI